MAANAAQVVLFIEVLDTTVGDSRGLARSDLLARVAAIVADNRGETIEAAGDEVLAIFTTPDAALSAACQAHQTISSGRGLVRSGMHAGRVGRRADHGIFGDAVNTAARVLRLGAPGQIHLTQEVVDGMHAETRSLVRLVDRVNVKGKQQELKIYRATWEPEDLNRTRIVAEMVRTGYLRDLAAEALELRHGEQQVVVRSSMVPVTLGRGDHCSLRVPTLRASRNHARIDYRRGKFILVDESTNGTYLAREDGSTSVLRREEAVLTGAGRIGLGGPAVGGGEGVVEFRCS
jgi:hypothetical protein